MPIPAILTNSASQTTINGLCLERNPSGLLVEPTGSFLVTDSAICHAKCLPTVLPDQCYCNTVGTPEHYLGNRPAISGSLLIVVTGKQGLIRTRIGIPFCH
ncbi:MAG: hypothetical protein R6U89_03065 [Dehalococcoidia bacterium]